MKIWKCSVIALATLAMIACVKQTAEEKIQANITTSIHALNADERQLAEINAKAFFNKEFPVETKDGSLSSERGRWLECRPSDSNTNGLVTCKGLVPNIKGGFKEVTRYCGYRPELVGCSDEDTVAK
jgi:hypothetical protein